MNAVVFEQTGSPQDVLKLKTIDIPEPGEGEVRVKMLASPINPADMLFIQGAYRIRPEFPQTAGLEGMGIIDKVHSNARFRKNERVAFRHKGLWAEYAIVPENRLIPLPDNFPPEKGCQISLNPITAYALLEEAQLKEYDWLLVNAGSSLVSKIILQLARLRGIKTIVVTRNEKEGEGLGLLGATKLLTSASGNLAEKIVNITDGKGVACVLDAVGDELLSELLTAMAPFGKVVSYGLLGKGNVSYHNATVVFKNLSITGFGIDAWLATRAKDIQDIYRSLVATLAAPDFQMPVSAVFPMSDFFEALEYQKNNANTGKILLSINNAEAG